MYYPQYAPHTDCHDVNSCLKTIQTWNRDHPLLF